MLYLKCKKEIGKEYHAVKQTLKCVRYFLLRDIRSRPLSFLSSVLIAMSAITALMLMMLYTEAAWRASVMPDHELNYHFTVKNLTYAQKNELRPSSIHTANSKRLFSSVFTPRIFLLSPLPLQTVA